ncbi:MAG: hypothetical protein PVH29_14945 [Candidatus Zixiibacteriota bacterium]|jgi:hypothetical protein
MKRWVLAFVALAVAAVPIACKKLEQFKKSPDSPLPFVGGESTAPAGTLGGTYGGSGTNPDGGSYICEVEITPRGKVYDVVWHFDGVRGYEGVGILKGDTFVVGFVSAAGYGVVAYTVKADGSLDGTWTGQGGTRVGTEKLKKR